MLNSHIQKTDMASIAIMVIATSSATDFIMMSHSHDIYVVRQIGDDGNSQVNDYCQVYSFNGCHNILLLLAIPVVVQIPYILI